MKRILMTVAVVVAMTAGTLFADAPAAPAAKDAKDAKDAKAEEAPPVKKGKPKPKKAMYTKLRAAKEAAADWEQPILAFICKQNDEDSTNLKRKVMNRKELKTFFTTNCVVMFVEIPTDRKNKMDLTKLGKDEAKLYDDAKTAIHGIELPASIVLDEKGTPKGQVGKYVIDVGVGTWLSMFDAALKTSGYGGAKMTKEAQKLIEDNKPDGKTKVQKDKK